MRGSYSGRMTIMAMPKQRMSMLLMTSRFPALGARFVSGGQSEATRGPVGIATIPNIFTVDAELIGILSRLVVFVRLAYTRGNGLRALTVSSGQSIRIGMRTPSSWLLSSENLGDGFFL